MTVAAASSRTARGLSVATAVSLALRLVGVAVGMTTTSLLARHLGPAGFGLFSLALTLGTGAAQMADMGLAVTVAGRVAREQASPAASRGSSDAESTAGAILSTGLALRTAAATTAAVALVVAALFGLFGRSSGLVGIVAVATPLSAASVLTAGATARFRPEISAVLALLQGLLWLAVVVAVAGTGAGATVLAWCFVVVTAVQTAVGLAMNRRVVPLRRPSFTQARRILALSWPLAVSSLAVMAYYRFDSVILFRLRGATELGYYSAAYKFLDVAQIGPSILVAPLLPLAAASLGLGVQRRAAILSLAVRTALIVGTGTAVLLIVLAHPLIRYVYGTGFHAAVASLVLLAVAFVGVSAGYVGTTVCTALGRVRPFAALTVVLAVVSLGVQVWACARWGMTGAAAVTAGTELASGVGTCVLAAKAMGAPLPGAAVGLTLLAGTAVVVLMLLLPLPWPVEGTLAAVLFGAALIACRVVTATDARRVLSRRVL